jgi:CheY-like chemotaxis protein
MAKKDEGQHTIMVVDDSEDIRELLRTTLNLSGYKVVEAANGEEAVELALRECPDLILMDLTMPVLDGYGAARQIREATEICDVPIVACSACTTLDHRAKALAVGFNAYLTKPFDFIQLSALLSGFLMAA